MSQGIHYSHIKITIGLKIEQKAPYNIYLNHFSIIEFRN